MTAFTETLTAIYRESPCQVLPNPLWKTLNELGAFRTSVETGRDGRVSRLEAASADKLYIHWTRESRKPSVLMSRRLRTVQWALVHQDYLDPDTVAGFSTRLSFFRLSCREQTAPPDLPPGYAFAAATPDQSPQIADFIARCYDDLKPTPDSVRDWAARAVYAPDLWLWVLDESTNQPAALAIGEHDPAINEAALEWIQTLPEYQGRGLARAAVRESLRRALARAAFVTVSGRVEDRDNPGAFYRKCGFDGQDVWWLLADPVT